MKYFFDLSAPSRALFLCIIFDTGRYCNGSRGGPNPPRLSSNLSRPTNKYVMKTTRIKQNKLKHVADVTTPWGEIIPCDVRKLTYYDEFFPDLQWISLVSKRPIGRHIDMLKRGYKFHWITEG